MKADSNIMLIHKLGAIVTAVADGLEDAGDQTTLASTNDGDLLKKARDLYFEWRFENDDAGPENILSEL